MSVLKLHWQFKQRFNKLDSDNYRDLTPMEIDERLNDAVGVFGETFFSDESHTQRLDWMSPLLYTETIPTVRVSNSTFSVDLSTLTHKYWHIKRVNASTDCGAIDFEITGHGRISDILRDEFQKPSKKWLRIVGLLENNKLIIHTDVDWDVDSITITYVRYPQPVFFGGYDTPEYIECTENCEGLLNRESSPQDLEITDYTVRRFIIELAVKEAHRILMNSGGVQLQQEKVNSMVNSN